ncbi:MAG TPA: hypothetical protein DCE41_37960 [Cytophagales bacterium]|nr:hypothetical protein [Cytophagales bacterium]
MKIWHAMAYLCFASFMVACGSNSSNDGEAETVTFQEEEPLDEALKEKVVAALDILPTPIEIVSHVRDAADGYNPALVNNPESSRNYLTTNFRKAVNLGVYMADLGYACLYTQAQPAMDFVRASKRVAVDMGLLDVFDPNIVKRFEDNLENRDSLINLLYESYYYTDDYLNKNERTRTAAIIMAGAWIEGMHIAASVAANHQDDESFNDLAKRVGDQKLTLNAIVEVLELISNDEEMATLVEQMKKLQTTFEAVEISDESVTEEIDLANLEDISQLTDMVLQSDLDRVNISGEALMAINQELASMRNYLITNS